MLLCLKTNLWPFWKACNFLTTLSTNPDFYFLFCSKEHKLTDWGLNVFVEVQSLKWISLEQSLSQGCFLLLPILKYLPPFLLIFFSSTVHSHLVHFIHFLSLFFFLPFSVLYLDYILVWETICWFSARKICTTRTFGNIPPPILLQILFVLLLSS